MICVIDSERMCVERVMYFFFQAEDGIRDLVRSRGLGDVYKRQQSPVNFLRVLSDCFVCSIFLCNQDNRWKDLM